MTTRIVVVDDDPLVRAGLRTLLRRDDVEILAEAADGVAALRLLDSVRPDAVLMDVQMPRLNGIAAIPAIRARQPGVRIVLMTTFDAERFAQHAKIAGADAFIRKSASVPEFLEALRGAKLEEARTRAALPPLSPREREVGLRIASGQSNDQIAAALGVSVNTVKTYVSRIFGKLAVNNRVQLANVLNDVPVRRDRLEGRPHTERP